MGPGETLNDRFDAAIQCVFFSSSCTSVAYAICLGNKKQEGNHTVPDSFMRLTHVIICLLNY